MPPKMDAVSISLVLPRREGRVMGGGGGPWQCGGMWRHMEGAWSCEGHVVEVVERRERPAACGHLWRLDSIWA
jgi:hypothetical protein